MKRTKNILMLAALALLAAACNNDGDNAAVNSYPSDGVIRVTPTIENARTRAGITNETFKNFYLYVENPVDNNYTYFVQMVKKNGEWMAQVPDTTLEIPVQMLWKNATQGVKVFAFSASKNVRRLSDFASQIKAIRNPYTRMSFAPEEDEDTFKYFYIASVTDISSFSFDTSIPIGDQTTEEKLLAADFLVATAKTVNPSTDLVNGKLPLTFHHAFSKLILKVNLGTEFNRLSGGTTVNPVSEVLVKNIPPIYIFSYNSSSSETGRPDLSVLPYYNASAYVAGSGDTKNAVAQYECIFPPCSDNNAFSVIFIVNGRSFIWTTPSPLNFEANTIYTLKLNVGKDVVTLGGISASAWQDGGTSELGTE